MHINKTMIYDGPIRLQDMYTLHRMGFEFVIEDGKVTKVITDSKEEKADAKTLF